MPVLMTMRVAGDPKKLEEQGVNGRDALDSIMESAKKHGIIAHRFYGSDDGQIMVVDLWPDPQSFQKFFEENGARIQPLIQATGAQGEPEVTFWHELDMPDKVGWEESESG
ncbi:MAG TPA: hypothetical protein VNF71_01625 [Acidimicrobiales bacterium]|nr:hypothetical protein [Acidimicrobiales bacterium]